jgi:hypothetical protein
MYFDFSSLEKSNFLLQGKLFPWFHIVVVGAGYSKRRLEIVVTQVFLFHEKENKYMFTF